jgi:hypothetical protein
VTWLALPTVWWGPLNVDEELTLRISDFSFRNIFHIVSTKRGGGPLHFWLEHYLLGWWPSLGALRIPSLVFLILALPAVALVVRRLLNDDEAAAAVVILTAVSPIPVLYATFGRPHTLLFAWLMWSTALSLTAAVRGDRRLWAAAGAALGLSVFVHPTAPLYALTAFFASAVFAPRHWRQVLREVWPGVVTLFITFVPYYVRTLHVLGDRYGVGTARAGGRTFSGRPVWEDALHFVAPGQHDVNYFTVLAVAGVVVLILNKLYRTLAFCAITVAAPVIFFSVVPANGDSALFFDRYMIPVTPAFLTVVIAACTWIAGLTGRWRFVVLVLLVAGLVGVEMRYDLNHRRQTERIHVDAVVDAVKRLPKGTVLFGSTGTSGAFFSSFDYGHPANILDHLIALRAGNVQLVDDDSCMRAQAFLRSSGTRRGAWVFYAASPEEAAAAKKALGSEPIDGHYFLVTSVGTPRLLIAEGLVLRRQWQKAVPFNRRVQELIVSDKQLLAGTCVPYGDLGDPDTNPHWPPVKTTHQ